MDEAVEVAVEHAFGVPDLVIGSMVLDHLVRVQDVAADLAAEAGVLSDAPLAGQLLLAPLLLELGQA